MTTIGEQAFYNCGNLTKITLPSTLTSIGNDCFGKERYYSEKELTFLSEYPPKINSSYGLGRKIGLTIFVPSQAVDRYKKMKNGRSMHNILSQSHND